MFFDARSHVWMYIFLLVGICTMQIGTWKIQSAGRHTNSPWRGCDIYNPQSWSRAFQTAVSFDGITWFTSAPWFCCIGSSVSLYTWGQVSKGLCYRYLLLFRYIINFKPEFDRFSKLYFCLFLLYIVAIKYFLKYLKTILLYLHQNDFFLRWPRSKPFYAFYTKGGNLGSFTFSGMPFFWVLFTQVENNLGQQKPKCSTFSEMLRTHGISWTHLGPVGHTQAVFI